MIKTAAAKRTGDEQGQDPAQEGGPEKAADAKVRETKPILQNQLFPIGYQHNGYSVILPAGVSPDDLTKPRLWSVIASKLRPYDTVQVIDIEEKFWAEVLVRSSERGISFSVLVLRVVTLPARTDAERAVLPPNHEIIFIASSGTYEAWRVSPSRVRMAEAKTWEAAREAIVNHASLRQA